MPGDLLSPRYWLWWLALGLLWLSTRLPYAWHMRLGAGLGRLFGALAARRRHIVDVNLRLCFPELNERERADLRRRHFAALGMSLMETALAWWGSQEKIQALGRVLGLEHLQAALARGKGVILFTGHFTSVEIGCLYLGWLEAGAATYRPNENPLLEYFLKQGRSRYAQRLIPREAVRDMLRTLKAGQTLFFAPDQNFGHKGSVFAPFFGISAATNTATTRLAKLSGAAVVPFAMRRLPQHLGYLVEVQPMLADFPGESEQADAERLNRLLEALIRQAPEQYLWAHRRFKDRPPGDAPLY